MLEMHFDPGDRVKVEKNGITYEGILMPSITRHLVIKLDNGYNLGLAREGAHVTLLEKKKALIPRAKPPVMPKKLPFLSILSTGGTIASKVDYRTGAVTSQFTAEDILQAIPELNEIANFDGKVVYSILSENMRPQYWVKLAKVVYEELKRGVDGIIITHGTDTMTYTAAALSFILETPVPIVLVGSQRSADRPSSDSAMNVICSARVATSDIAEVCVAMHGSTSDDYCVIHRGTKVRKMHTSRRDAFQSINARPIGRVGYPSREIEILSDYAKRGEKKLLIHEKIEPKCCLVKFSPGASPEALSFYLEAGYRGIVLEGTGLGHVSTEWIPLIERATKAGVPVVMTSQCIRGRVCDRVYDTGRDLLRAGVIEGGDMLPEVALVKLMFVLGKSKDMDEVRRLMKTSIVGEISPRSISSK